MSCRNVPVDLGLDVGHHIDAIGLAFEFAECDDWR